MVERPLSKKESIDIIHGVNRSYRELSWLSATLGVNGHYFASEGNVH